MMSRLPLMPAVRGVLVLGSLLGAKAALSGEAPASRGTLVATTYESYVEVVLSVPTAVIPSALHGVAPRKGAPEAPPYFFQLGGGDGFMGFPAEAMCHSDGDWVMRIDSEPGLDPDFGSQRGNTGPMPIAPPGGRWLVAAYQFHCNGLMPVSAISWIRLDVFDLLPDLQTVTASMPGRAPGETQALTRVQREFRMPAAPAGQPPRRTARE